MRRVIGLLIIFMLLIGMQPVGSAQDTGGFVCPENTAGGLGLTGAGTTVNGYARCIYGPVWAVFCPPVTLDGRNLLKQVIKASGKARCVYADEG